MTGTYKFIDHTADVAFDVEAETIEELFTASSKAWKETVLEKEPRLQASEQKSLALKSASLEQLLVDFLSELNYLMISKKWMFLSVEKLKIKSEDGTWNLSAKVKGSKLSDDLKIIKEIKAVTYHQMEIVHKNNKYKTRVVFDI
jgi:SHS2 domain-containing protein